MNYTTLAEVDEDKCVGYGMCVQNCSAEAIELVDTVAVVNDNRCIGYGVCAYLCPENSMKEKIWSKECICTTYKTRNQLGIYLFYFLLFNIKIYSLFESNLII